MNANPHILFVTGEYPPLRGGVADYTMRLRSALADIEIDSIVLTSEGAEGDGIHTIGSWSWPVALHIREIANMERVDAVHIQYQAGAFDMHPAINALPTALSAWLRIPVITTFHDLRVPYLFPRAGRLRQAVMLRMARASSRVVVTNPGDQRVLESAEICPTKIPLGPSLPAPSNGGWTEPSNSIGFFGFPSREKGVVELIQAIGMFQNRPRPELTLVGATRPDTGTHEYMADQEVDRIAKSSRVKLDRTGYLEPQAASDRLSKNDVISLPFVRGASQRSSALIAALRLGRPVVTTSLDVRDDLDSLSDLPQLIKVAPEDAHELHSALRRAMEHEIDAEPLPEQYHWHAIAARHGELYADALNSR